MFLRKMKEKKLPNEEIIKYFCCYHWYGLIPKHFHYLTTTITENKIKK